MSAPTPPTPTYPWSGIQIAGLPAAQTLTGSELAVVIQGGIASQTTIGAILAAVQSVGVVSGSVSPAVNATGATFTFPQAFSVAPNPANIQVWVTKKTGFANVSAFLNVDSITTTGFTVDFSGAIPSLGYVCYYKIIP